MIERISAAAFRAGALADESRRTSKYRAVAAYRCKGCDAPAAKDQPRCRLCGSTDKRHFPSRGEAKRYDVLKAEERRGEISDLECQPVFELIVNGIRIGVYKADFRYRRNGSLVVEDFKSGATMTEAATLRMKLAEAVHGITIRKVSGQGG